MTLQAAQEMAIAQNISQLPTHIGCNGNRMLPLDEEFPIGIGVVHDQRFWFSSIVNVASANARPMRAKVFAQPR